MGTNLDRQMQSAEQEWLDGWEMGPLRVRWTEMPLQVGDRAPSFDLLDSASQRRELSEFWSDGPALILFWRHYGCGYGMGRAARLNEEMEDYNGQQANIVIIGQGEPERAAAYAAKYNLPPITILCDPEYQVYKAYGLIDGKLSQILYDAPEEYQDLDYEAGAELAKARKEAGQPLVDNSWLLPGEFVVDQSGEVRLAYRYNYCEDFPDHRVLVAALREARLQGSVS
jgi:peroxiredoxin